VTPSFSITNTAAMMAFIFAMTESLLLAMGVMFGDAGSRRKRSVQITAIPGPNAAAALRVGAGATQLHSARSSLPTAGPRCARHVLAAPSLMASAATVAAWIPWSGLQLFIRVVETGSFSKASADLGITQPTATKHVAALEARLGARLLHRSTRGVTPTEVGAAYYDKCKVHRARARRGRQPGRADAVARAAARCASAPRWPSAGAS
jgi:hypothetical protein